MKILLVDDDPQSLESTKRILEHAEYQVETAASGVRALEWLSSGGRPDLIVTDVRMPGMSGMQFVEAFQKRGLKIPFVVMTAFGQVQDAVWAMKMGAVDFLLKPFKRQSLIEAVEQSTRRKSSPKEAALNAASDEFVGASKAVQKLKVLMDQVAKTDASVLLLGESGSGKERVARFIHARSSRSKGPFVAINCAAIPENLIESELFGYERGAFSGASQSRMGLFEAANGGTLLLDEIGDLPLALQPKLLRVLEDQRVRRLGGNSEKQINVRLIAATHQNLSEQVKQGRFRQDLFYRLDVMTLSVPPLRDRIEDIPALVEYFLGRFAVEHQKQLSRFSSDALQRLMAHRWPGNIRELSNVVERSVVLTDGPEIGVSDLPLSIQVMSEASSPTPSESITIPLGMSLKEVEDLMIEKALHATDGDRAEAAKLLGLNERTIYRRIRKPSSKIDLE